MAINYSMPMPERFSGFFGTRNPTGNNFNFPWAGNNYPQLANTGSYFSQNTQGIPYPSTTPTPVAAAPTASLGGGINYGLADTRANTVIGMDLSGFRTPTETTNWYGKTVQGIDYNHLGAFTALSKNTDFNNYFKTLSPQQQQWIKANAATLNTQNLETINAQMNTALASQANNAWTKSDIFGGIQAGVGALVGLGNLWSGYKQTKLMEKNFEEQKALNRANFTNQAKQINNAYRDQGSGRGTTVMSDSARRSIGEDVRRKYVKETY